MVITHTKCSNRNIPLSFNKFYKKQNFLSKKSSSSSKKKININIKTILKKNTYNNEEKTDIKFYNINSNNLNLPTHKKFQAEKVTKD